MSSNEVVVDDVHVTLSDGNEDLLEYQTSDANLDAIDKQDVLDKHDVMDGNKDEQARAAAKSLLRKSPAKTLIHYEDDTFLLFDYDDKEDDEEDEDTSSYPIICEDIDICNTPCTNLVASLRQFLETFYNRIMFGTKEILLHIPSLDITICEDNVYNNQISFDDIQTIFNILKQRSKANNERNIPNCLEGTISLRPRFVSRYNALVELTESVATFKNIKPFSNDEENPVVLDDDEDDDDGEDDEDVENEIDVNDEAMDVDSDELEEISQEEEDNENEEGNYD